MEFRSGSRCTKLTISPQLKVKRSAAKKRLTYDVPAPSTTIGLNVAVPEILTKILYDDVTNEAMRRVISELLKYDCQAYVVGNLTKPTWDEKTLGECQQKIISALNDRYSRVGYAFKAVFRVIQGVRARDWDGDAILLKIGRKRGRADSLGGPPLTNQNSKFTQVFQCLFAGRDTHNRNFCHLTSSTRKFRPLLLVQDSSNIFVKIKEILVDSLKIYIATMRPVIGQELKVFCGRCFLMTSIKKSLDSGASMILSTKYNRSHDGKVQNYEYECQIPILYFKEFISHSTMEQVTNANVMEIWFQLFKSLGAHLPINLDFPLNVISFPGFRFSSQGQIQVVDPSLELCQEVLETLTRFAR